MIPRSARRVTLGPMAVVRLTPRVLELGYGYLPSPSLAEIKQPHFRELSWELA